MILNYKYSFLLLIIFVTHESAVLSQNTKRRNKGTSRREIRKRQEEANEKSQYNKFNELQPMGQKSSQARTDFVWSYETANTTPLNAGDVSLVGPSRFCFKRELELGGAIGTLPIAPSFYIKKKWAEGKIYIATRHQVYSYSPMLYWAQQLEYSSVFPLNETVPITIGLKNELILSKPFLKDLNCGSIKQPYIILTGAVGLDYGFSAEKTEVDLMQRKLLRQRSGVILGEGGFITARLQGDFYLLEDLYATVAFRGLFSGSDEGNSVEQNSMLRFKLTPSFSLSGGYWLTLGKGAGSAVISINRFNLSFW